MITIYKCLGIFLIPFIKINLVLRILKGKEDKKRYLERFGVTYVNRPHGRLIWIHAASIGEFKSADFLINELHQKYNILVTTTTLSAANFAMKNYEGKIIHQFAPLDVSFWIKKFLIKWDPFLVIWVESDLWPITMKIIKEKAIKSLLVNVRMSPKSFKKWKNIKYFYKQMTECFSEIFAQSLLDKERIEELTNRDIQFIGNLKLSSYNNKKNNFANNQNLYKKNKVLIFASTHTNEEIQFLPILKKILTEDNKTKIVIAPRHPERASFIMSAYLKSGILTSIVSNAKNLKSDVSIIDTFGDLDSFFKISDIVVLGGSFVQKGGHNPIEAAINNCAIITGPYIYNWQNIYDEMLKNNACVLTNNILQLEKNILHLLKNKNELTILKNKAKNLSQKKFFDSEKLLYSIQNLIGKEFC